MRGAGSRIALTLVAVLGGGGAAQAETPLFASDTPITLTIRGGVAAAAAGKEGDQPATLTTGAETLAVTLSPRGITRRKRTTCQFAPLRVAFPSPPAAGSLFAGQRRLKLVTHCRGAETFQQYVLLEYAAYRLYNALTPLSFRARLATIDYQDEAGKPIVRRQGFFIEDVDDVAARNRLARARTGDSVPPTALSQADAGRFAVFSYAIANLDWSMSAGPPGEGCCHNARLFQGKGGLVPVPYDFDFAGIVDAPYATPPQNVPVANVRVRRYRGQCALNAAATAAAADLVARRSDLNATLAAVPGLNPDRLQKARNFLNASLDELATPDKMLKTCR